MPTYEYRCDKCGEHHEVVQSFRDEPLTECPACGGPLRKVFGAIGVVFKGSGFYKTDSRTSAKAGDKSSAKDTGTGKDGEKKDGEKKDGEKKGAKDSSSETKESNRPSAESTKSSNSGSGTPAGSAAAAS
jgi:putative FmdB family regulatory protein